MFKVGDRVRAIDDYYGVTSKRHNWVGEVVEVHSKDTFSAKTISCNSEWAGGSTVFDGLKSFHFIKDTKRNTIIIKNNDNV